MLFGETLAIVATVLFTFADRPERYWSFVFPGCVIGSAGVVLTYTHAQ